MGAAVDQRAVQELVEHYEGKARDVARAGLVGGAIVGVVFGAVPLSPLDFIVSVPSSFGFATVLFGLIVGLLVGFVIGDSRARMYHRMAEQARMQLDLEQRLSQSDARMAQLVAALTNRAQAAARQTPPAPAAVTRPAPPAPAPPVAVRPAQPPVQAPVQPPSPAPPPVQPTVRVELPQAPPPLPAAPPAMQPVPPVQPVPPLVRAFEPAAAAPQVRPAEAAGETQAPLLRQAPPVVEQAPPPLPPVLTSVPAPSPPTSPGPPLSAPPVAPTPEQEPQRRVAASGGQSLPAPPLSPPLSS